MLLLVLIFTHTSYKSMVLTRTHRPCYAFSCMDPSHHMYGVGWFNSKRERMSSHEAVG